MAGLFSFGQRHVFRLAFSLLVANGVLLAHGAQTLVDVSDGTTLDLSSADNVSTVTLVFGSGCTLRLSGNAGGGLFKLQPCIIATNGTLTVDATALVDCTGIRWQNQLTADTAITVKGLDFILFGYSSVADATKINYGYLNADFTFVDGSGSAISNPAGLVFTNMVIMAKVPTCPYSIAKGTWLWPYKTDWPEVAAEAVELTDFNYGVLYQDSLNAFAIKVGAGCELSCRPCNLVMRSNDPGYWASGGIAGTWQRDVQLCGGALKLVANNEFTLDGAITGFGDIHFSGNSTTTLNGAHAVTGTVHMSGNRLVFSDGGSSCRSEFDVVFENDSRGRIAFQPIGCGTVATEVSLKSVIGLSTNNVIAVQDMQAVIIGDVGGALTFQGSPNGSSVAISNLAAGATLRIPDGLTVTVLSAGYGAKVVFANDNGTGSYRLAGPSAGARVSLNVECESSTPTLTAGGRLSLEGLPIDLTSLTLLADADLAGDVPYACAVHSRGGKWVVSQEWQRKVALWCDASATRTLEDGTVTNTFIYANEISAAMAGMSGSDTKIWKWLDCRPAQTTYAFGNKRFKNTDASNLALTVYPYEETVDGVVCVSMGSTASHLNIFNLDTSLTTEVIPSAYAIIVFGSQLGGGSAVLGTQDGAFARNGYGKATADAAKYHIFTNAYETYVNGTEVDPTTIGFNGGWQILSVDTEGKEIQGIGYSRNGTNNTPTDRSYSRYAEVMLFSEKPTDTERRQIEEYLSAKWGIAISHTNTVAQQRVRVSGCGEIALDSSAELAGSFSGTIDLNGNRLVLPAARLPFTDAEVPETGLMLWLDPSMPGSLVMGGEAARPLEVDALMPRTATGLASTGYFMQSAFSEDGVTNRRPHVAIGSRGGAATTWLDFANAYDDSVNNVLIIRAMPYSTAPTAYDVGDWNGGLSVRTAFVVLDSSRGGGTPFVSWANGNGGDLRMRGKNPTAADPIWSAGCADALKSGTTRLNGADVNGTADGFSGAPEVLSFAVDGGATVTVKAMACFNVNAQNQEIMGEALLYRTVLDEGYRSGIEAYLMKKWIGKVPAGFTDFRDVTITGSGVVEVQDMRYMPTLGAGFSGGVAVTTNHLAFAFADSAVVADNAISIPGAMLAFPAEVSVSLAFETSPSAGVRYTLISGSFDASATEFTIDDVRGAGSKRLQLVYDEVSHSLCAEVVPRGIAVSIR